MPDTAPYLALGLGVVFSILGVYIGSLIMRLINNSTRILRRRIIQMLFENIDVAQHIRFHQQLMAQIINNSLSGYAVMDHYRTYLANLSQPLRNKLRSMPQEPRLLSSPL